MNLYGSPDLKTFTECGTLPTGTTRIAFAYKPGVLVAQTPTDLYYSTDKGATWTVVVLSLPENNPNPNNTSDQLLGDIQCLSGEAFYVFMSFSNGYGLLFRSVDGVNWTYDSVSASASQQNVKMKIFSDFFNKTWVMMLSVFIEGAPDIYLNNFYGDVIGEGIVGVLPSPSSEVSAHITLIGNQDQIAIGKTYVLVVDEDGHIWYSSDLQTWVDLLGRPFETNLPTVFYSNGNFYINDQSTATPQYLIIPENDLTATPVTVAGNFIPGYLFQAGAKVHPISTAAHRGVYQQDRSKVFNENNLAAPTWSSESTGIPAYMALQHKIHGMEVDFSWEEIPPD
jgi:hypothetical protein